jgi:hypothetical protein
LRSLVSECNAVPASSRLITDEERPRPQRAQDEAFRWVGATQTRVGLTKTSEDSRKGIAGPVILDPRWGRIPSC